MNHTDKFIGESAEEATISLQITGSPSATQRAIKQLAKKASGRSKKKGAVDTFVEVDTGEAKEEKPAEKE